jgi:hypothetical protein
MTIDILIAVRLLLWMPLLAVATLPTGFDGHFKAEVQSPTRAITSQKYLPETMGTV